MLMLALTGIALAVIAGAAIKVITDRSSLTQGRITGIEFAVGALACSLLVVPGVTAIGVKMAQASAVSYNEYWSGFETAARMETIRCSKDGPCRHEYDCDPYFVTETYTEQEPYTATESDGKGGTRTVTKYRTVTKTRQVQKWHACPYTNTEHTFTVSDSMGETHVLGDHWFPANPEQHRWRDTFDFGLDFRGLPSVPSGEPPLWTAAKARLDAGNPGGVTTVHDYDNYILASQTTILKRYSDAIERYRADKLMPTPAKGVRDHYLADKAYFVGKSPGDPAAWQESVMRFNGALGTERQGDLHLILVTHSGVTNPDEYTGAVQAYWQSPELGKNALSKNGLVVVLGSIDGGRTVEWARAFTGMPVGNESVTVAIREDLPGADLTPEAILGTPKAKVSGEDVTVAHTDGALENLVFDAEGFTRVCMSCEGEDDEGVGYSYLASQIQPSAGQKVAIVAIGFVLALGVWAVLLVVGEAAHHPLRRDALTGAMASPRRARYRY